ncbi:hypothetical protein Tco_1161234 [Tanacetum coccineum]
MDLCTKLSDRVLNLETTKTTQAKDIASLKKRVRKLERKRKSKTLGMKRLFKVGRSAQVVSSEDEVILVDETQGRYDDAQMFDIDVFNGEKVFVAEQSEKVVEEVVSIAEVSAAATITTEEITLAQALAELRSVKPKVMIQEPVQSTTTIAPSTIPKAKSITFRDPGKSTTRPTLTPIPLNIKDKGKAKMIKPEKPLKMKEQIRLDEELAFKLQAKEEEQARLARDKAEKVKEANISRDNVQAMTEADRLLAERLQAREQEELIDEEKARLFKAEAEMAQESSSKRAGEKLEQEVAKKQKMEDDKEKEDLKNNCSEIALENQWKLVKAKHGNTRPEEGYERVLWGDLKTMFEHHVEDLIWRNLQGKKVLLWRLYDSCGIHFVRFEDMHVYMLVEKRYPLTPATIINMLNKKLQADY